MRTTLIFLLFVCISSSLLAGNKTKEDFSPDQTITILKETSFPIAIQILENMAQQYEGKKIINMTEITKPIDIPINDLFWKDALILLAKYNNIIIEDLPGAYKLVPRKKEEKPEEEEITIDTKQIRISSIFFKADKIFLNNMGIDWSTLYHGKVEASLNFSSSTRISDEILSGSFGTRIESGDVKIDINTLLKIIESHQLGTVIARPNVVVLSGKKGYIQVGEDYSVKTADEAGNITDEFFSTGIILEVIPNLITQKDKESIHLDVSVEKSSAVPGQISTIIHKSQSETEVLLYDGEETVIGGLYDTEYTYERAGIPILKDLPWWFFGIRYLTGYNAKKKNIREFIIILKAEILEPIEARIKKATTTKEEIEKVRIDNSKIDTLFKTDEEEKKDD